MTCMNLLVRKHDLVSEGGIGHENAAHLRNAGVHTFDVTASRGCLPGRAGVIMTSYTFNVLSMRDGHGCSAVALQKPIVVSRVSRAGASWNQRSLRASGLPSPGLG